MFEYVVDIGVAVLPACWRHRGGPQKPNWRRWKHRRPFSRMVPDLPAHGNLREAFNVFDVRLRAGPAHFRALRRAH